MLMVSNPLAVSDVLLMVKLSRIGITLWHPPAWKPLD